MKSSDIFKKAKICPDDSKTKAMSSFLAQGADVNSLPSISGPDDLGKDVLEVCVLQHFPSGI